MTSSIVGAKLCTCDGQSEYSVFGNSCCCVCVAAAAGHTAQSTNCLLCNCQKLKDCVMLVVMRACVCGGVFRSLAIFLTSYWCVPCTYVCIMLPVGQPRTVVGLVKKPLYVQSSAQIQTLSECLG